MKRCIDRVVLAALVTAIAHTAAAQPPPPPPAPPNWKIDFIGPEIPLGPMVRNAPYSADAITTVSQTLGNGTQISRTVTAKLFRDSEGRVRREQTILGLGVLDPGAESQTIVTIVDPVAHVTYVLDPRTRQARRLPVAKAQAIERSAVPPPPPPPPPPPSGELQARPWRETRPNWPQELGQKQIEGVDVVGVRRVETIPAGRIGNDRPIEIVDERWESPVLKMLVQSQHRDPRTGDVEYKLTNITRAEPPRELFTVPADYTVVDSPERRE
jgi:hypothetical protein